MKIIFVNLSAFLLLFSVTGTSSYCRDQDMHDWENPQMTGRNIKTAHVTLIPYNTVRSALKGNRYSSPNFILLNGS